MTYSILSIDSNKCFETELIIEYLADKISLNLAEYDGRLILERFLRVYKPFRLDYTIRSAQS